MDISQDLLGCTLASYHGSECNGWGLLTHWRTDSNRQQKCSEHKGAWPTPSKVNPKFPRKRPGCCPLRFPSLPSGLAGTKCARRCLKQMSNRWSFVGAVKVQTKPVFDVAHSCQVLRPLERRTQHPELWAAVLKACAALGLDAAGRTHCRWLSGLTWTESGCQQSPSHARMALPPAPRCSSLCACR